MEPRFCTSSTPSRSSLMCGKGNLRAFFVIPRMFFHSCFLVTFEMWDTCEPSKKSRFAMSCYWIEDSASSPPNMACQQSPPPLARRSGLLPRTRGWEEWASQKLTVTWRPIETVNLWRGTEHGRPYRWIKFHMLVSPGKVPKSGSMMAPVKKPSR